MRLHSMLIAAVLLVSCSEADERSAGNAPSELPPDVRQDRETKLDQARATYEANPSDADAIIWLGRRTAYLGGYRDAIAIYSEGIEVHPDDPRMYRHRGHRYITVRQFDDAVADLEKAAELISGTADEVEPDGLPNALNIPTSTLHSNIWYHLGLAYYLKGDLENALRTYRECMKVSNNPDMLVATTHWLYMTLRRLGREEEASAVLEPIDAGMDIIENQSYQRLLLMYKGELDTDDLLAEAEAGSAIENATLGYGIGNWQAYNGRPKQAEEVLRNVLKGPQWAAFGYIAAEADLKRLQDLGALGSL